MSVKEIVLKCSGEEYYDIDDLVPFQKKLKSIDKDKFKDLKDSIIKDGLPLGFHIWKDKGVIYIMDGHHRQLVLKACRSEGYLVPKVPCSNVIAKNKKEAAKNILIANSKYAKITDESLSDYMIEFELQLEDLEYLDFPELNMTDLLTKDMIDSTKGLVDEDEVPEVAQNIHNVELGQVWKLGEHRLVCGDSTDLATVDILMDGEKADMVFTDPPYGINAISSSGVLSSRYKQYKNEENDSCALNFLNLCIERGEKIICFGGNYFAHALPKSTHWIIWDKRGSDMEGGSKNGDQSDCEIAWTNLEKKNVKIYKHVWAGWFRAGNKKEELKTKVHPSQKPVGLFEKIFEDYVFTSIFDGFGGSGSTLIACEKTNRKCFMMEIDPHYCSVIIERWQNFTGIKAEILKS